MARHWRIVTHVVVWIATGLVVATALAAGGGALNDPQKTYVSTTRGAAADDIVVATVTLQLVSYELNSVAGKYRLIPVLLRAGRRQAPVMLSLEQDSLVVISNGQRITGSFQLSALDRALWDGLSPEMRNRLTYPEQLKPDSAMVVYAFAPLTELKAPPSSFEYTIKSLGAPLLLKPEAAKAAALPGPGRG
jgi:hypothetical protein